MINGINRFSFLFSNLDFFMFMNLWMVNIFGALKTMQIKQSKMFKGLFGGIAHNS